MRARPARARRVAALRAVRRDVRRVRRPRELPADPPARPVRAVEGRRRDGDRAAGAAMGSLLRPLGGRLADRIGGLAVLTSVYGVAAALLLFVSGLPPAGAAGAAFVVCMGTLGVGNGAVFQLVGLRFGERIGVLTGLVGAAGGLGGFFLPSRARDAARPDRLLRRRAGARGGRRRARRSSARSRSAGRGARGGASRRRARERRARHRRRHRRPGGLRGAAPPRPRRCRSRWCAASRGCRTTASRSRTCSAGESAAGRARSCARRSGTPTAASTCRVGVRATRARSRRRRRARSTSGEVLRFDRAVARAPARTRSSRRSPASTCRGVHVFREPGRTARRSPRRRATARHAAVIGGGLLGLEAARGVAALGCADDRRPPRRPADGAPARRAGAAALLAPAMEALGVERAARAQHRRSWSDRRRASARCASPTAASSRPTSSSSRSGSAPQIDARPRGGAGRRARHRRRRPRWSRRTTRVLAVGECAQHRGVVHGHRRADPRAGRGGRARRSPARDGALRRLGARRPSSR